MQLLQVTNTHHHITTDGLLMFISINTLVVIIVIRDVLAMHL